MFKAGEHEAIQLAGALAIPDYGQGECSMIARSAHFCRALDKVAARIAHEFCQALGIFFKLGGFLLRFFR